MKLGLSVKRQPWLASVV